MMTKEIKSFSLSEQVQDLIENNAEALGVNMSQYIETAVLYHDEKGMSAALREDLKKRKGLREVIKRRHNRCYREVGNLINEQEEK